MRIVQFVVHVIGGGPTPKPVLPDLSGDQAWDHSGLADNLLLLSSVGQELKEVCVEVPPKYLQMLPPRSHMTAP